MKTKFSNNCLFVVLVVICFLVSPRFAVIQTQAGHNTLQDNFPKVVVDVNEIIDGTYYYYQGQKIPLKTSPNRLVIKFKETLEKDQVKQLIIMRQLQEDDYISRRELHIVETSQKRLALSDLLTDANVEYVTPIMLSQKGTELVITNEFMVKFKDDTSETAIISLNQRYNAEIIYQRDSTGTYLMKVPWNSALTSLDVANVYFESGLVAFATPNWVERSSVNFIVPSDEYFSQQWALDNNHLNASSAWDVYSNDQKDEVVVAVLDTGVQPNHPDLIGRLVSGYDEVDDDNDPTPGNNIYDMHGTGVSGIIVSAMNQIGVVGIAPNLGYSNSPTVKVMPVRVVAPIQDVCNQDIEPEWVANGIEFAVTNGA